MSQFLPYFLHLDMFVLKEAEGYFQAMVSPANY